MENDSLSVVPLDSVDHGDLVADSAVAEVQMPTPEQLGISVSFGVKDASGAIAPLNVTVGDTIDFPVTVSWSVNGSALLVMPTGTATAKGLAQVGVSQESARTVKDGKEMASITFNYKIAAQDTGNLSIPVMKFEIPTQMGQPLTLRTESVPVRVDEPTSLLPIVAGGVVAIVVLLAGLWRVKRQAAKRAAVAAKKASENALQGKMMVLKQRVNSADSREWILELERICKEYAAEQLKLNADQVNLETLAKNGDLSKLGDEDGWKSLLTEFAHARYGGGKRDGFENKETWKLAMKVMNVNDDE